MRLYAGNKIERPEREEEATANKSKDHKVFGKQTSEQATERTGYVIDIHAVQERMKQERG